MESDLRYPIGKYKKPEITSPLDIKKWINNIAEFPKELESLIENLSQEQLLWAYRPEGWTVHQVIHHCADSHMNAIIRFKLALTEDNPTIKPYREDLWAKLDDTVNLPIEHSLQILNGLHRRWEQVLKAISNEDLQRTFIHPEQNEKITIAQNIAQYDWHCRHHLGHIRQAIQSKGSYTKFK